MGKISKINGINYILYKHIADNYSSVSNFADISGIPHQKLSAFLLNDNIIREIILGFKIFRFLKLDPEKFLFLGEIHEAGGGRENFVGEFSDRYMRLSEVEKQNVIEFMAQSENI